MKKKLFTRILTVLLAIVLFLGDCGIANAAPVKEEWGTSYENCIGGHHDLLRTRLAHYQGYTGSGVRVAILGNGTQMPKHESVPEMETYDIGLGTEEVQLNSFRTDYIASIIAGTGKTDEVKGTCGIAPTARIISIKVVSDKYITEGLDNTYLAKGINTAVEKNADIICIPVTSVKYSPEVEAAIFNAYQAGVAVFCAAGEALTSSLPYPCTYKGAIPVTGLTDAMTLLPDANYGSKIRYSAIANVTGAWNSDSAYYYYNTKNTASATAVTVGAAAILWNEVDGSGKKKVDNLLRLMDKSCTKAQGSGTGKGMVNLAKALKIKDYDQAPAKPVILNDTFKVNGEEVLVKFAPVPEDVKIYISCDNHPLNVAKMQYDYLLDADSMSQMFKMNANSSNKKLVVRAVAYNTKNHMKSAESRATFTFDLQATDIELKASNKNINLSQPFLPGKSFGIKVVSVPMYAKVPKVKWEVLYKGQPTNMVTVSASGLVRINRNATPGAYIITAKAVNWDGTDSYAKSISINVASASKNPVKKIITPDTTVYVEDGGETVIPITVIKKDGTYGTTRDIMWSISGTGVRVVDDTHISVTTSVDNGMLCGFARDGGGAKIEIAVKKEHLRLVSSIKVDYINDVYACVQGGSLPLKTEVYPSDAINRDLNWYISPGNDGLTISNGTVNVAENVPTGTYTIRAFTSGDDKIVFSEEIDFQVISKDEEIAKIIVNDKSVLLSDYVNYDCDVDFTCLNAKGEVIKNPKIIARSSNPVVSIRTKDGLDVSINYKARTSQAQTATVSIYPATNGKSKKASFKVTVATTFEDACISVQSGRGLYLTKGASVNLNTFYYDLYGKSDNRCRKPEFYLMKETSNFKLNKNGRLTALSDSGIAEIGVRFADGNIVGETITFRARPRYKQIYFKTEDKTVTSINAKVGEKVPVSVYADSGYNLINLSNVEVNREGMIIQKNTGTCYYLIPSKPGTYKVTFKATDGSNVRKALTVKVTE